MDVFRGCDCARSTKPDLSLCNMHKNATENLCKMHIDNAEIVRNAQKCYCANCTNLL